MHRDTKLGLALGVLLVGVVTAFFFRNEEPGDVPQLEDPESVDARIAEQEVTPYLETPPTLGDPQAELPPAPPFYDLPEFLRDDAERDPLARRAAPPDPLLDPGRSLPAPPPPRENAAWEIVDKTTPNKSARPQWHQVRPGDTLTGLAARYFGNPAAYTRLYEANRDQLTSPDDLKVGMRIRVPAKDAVIPTSQPVPTTKIKTANPPEETTTAEAGAVEPSTPTREVSQEKSAVPSAPEEPAPSEVVPEAEEPGKRFVPVRRGPFIRRAGRPQRLSQKPPEDLPPLE